MGANKIRKEKNEGGREISRERKRATKKRSEKKSSKCKTVEINVMSFDHISCAHKLYTCTYYNVTVHIQPQSYYAAAAHSAKLLKPVLTLMHTI